MNSDIFEKILGGANHAEIGAQIAEKWNFPAVLTGVIRYHHSPESAPDNCKKIAICVYVADLMVHYLDKEVEYYQIDEKILSSLNITSEDQFKIIADRITKKMESR